MTLALNRRFIISATGANIILNRHQKLCHRSRSQIARHRKVSNLVESQVGDLSWSVTLMPVSGDEYPSALTDLGKKGFVGGSDIRRDILLVDAISNASSVELVLDFGTVPVLIKVEGEIRQPFP
jgi:hypothetical protein